MNESYRPTRVVDLLGNPPAPPPMIVDGLLWVGTSLVIAAPRSVGKSWFVMQLAVAIACGDGDFVRFSVGTQRRVLLVHGETEPSAQASRWRLLLDGGPPPEGLWEWFEPTEVRVRTQRRSAHDSESEVTTIEDWQVATVDPRLVQVIDELGIEVLIVDPWATFYRGEENSNEQVEAALAELRRLCRSKQVALVLVHHFGKSTSTRDPEDQWRGASRLPDWAHVRLTLSVTKGGPRGQDRDAQRRLLDATVISRFEPVADFSMRRDAATNLFSRVDPSRSATAKVTDDRALVRSALKSAGGEFRSLNAAVKKVGIHRSRAEAALVALERDGEVVSGVRGTGQTAPKWYRLAP